MILERAVPKQICGKAAAQQKTFPLSEVTAAAVEMWARVLPSIPEKKKKKHSGEDLIIHK